MKRSERGALSPKGLRAFLRWADPKCGSAIRARAMLAIHEIIDAHDERLPDAEIQLDAIKRILKEG